MGSLDAVLQLPADVLMPAAVAAGVTTAGVVVIKLAKILDAIKRVAGFGAELRIQHTQLQAGQLDAETDLLEAEERVADARARQRRRQLAAAGWELDRLVVTEDDDHVL